MSALVNYLQEKISCAYNINDKNCVVKNLMSIIDTIKGNSSELFADDSFDLKTHIQNINSVSLMYDKETDEEKKKSLKKKKAALKYKLPVFLPSIHVKGNHDENNFTDYTNIISIDIDKLTSEKIEKLKILLNKIPSLIFYFVSPSGMGIKCFFAIENENITDVNFVKSLHLHLFDKFRETFKKNGFVIDESCKNIGRLCYISYDPNLYLNEKIKPIKITTTQIKSISKKSKQIELKGKGQDYVLETFYEWISANTDIFLQKQNEYQKWFLLFNSVFKYLEKNEEQTKSFCHRVMSFKSDYDFDSNEKHFDHWIKSHDSSKAPHLSYMLTPFLKEGLDLGDKALNKEFLESKSTDIPFMLEEQEIYLTRDKWTNSLQFVMRGKKTDPTEEVYNASINYIREIYDKKLNKNDIREYIDDERYIKIVDNFTKILNDNKSNDATDLENFIDCLTTDNNEAFLFCLIDSMMGVFDNVFTKNYYKYIFVLKGRSNVGKTFVMRKLISPFDEYKSENFKWKDYDKDNLIQLTQNIFIYDDELAATTKADIESIKSMTSMDSVNIRPPYGHRAIKSKRIASFFGSSNPDQFYKDDTGAYRFISFELKDVNRELLSKINFSKAWGYVWNLYNSNQREMVSEKRNSFLYELNESSRITSPEEDVLRNDYIITDKYETQALQIFNYLKLQGLNNITYPSINKILKNLGYEKKKTNKGYMYNCKLKNLFDETFSLTKKELLEKYLDDNDIDIDELLDIKSKLNG